MELKLLIVEDDHLMAEAAADYFTGKGWRVKTAEHGIQARKLLKEENFHLILLDVMMPEMDGFSLCREIRKSSDVPVIFITARVMEEDKLNGYSLGADDYVTKPFSLPVLYAKAMALTKRVQEYRKFLSQGHLEEDGLKNGSSFLELGNLKIDRKSHQVWKSGEPLSLPPKEYEMLVFFLENPRRIFSREQLLIRFWGYDFDGNERVVDNHIKKLRKAIGSCGCTIETVRKSGYRLEAEE